MFYCNDCAKEKGLPFTPFKSRGKCEVCGFYAACNDTPCRILPSRGEPTELGKQLKDYTDRAIESMGLEVPDETK